MNGNKSPVQLQQARARWRQLVDANGDRPLTDQEHVEMAQLAPLVREAEWAAQEALRRLHQPLPSWRWVHQPIWPSQTVPDGLPGMLIIDGTCYLVTPDVDHTAHRIVAFRMTEADGAVFDVDTENWRCDCPASTGPQSCLHSRALVAALAQALQPDRAPADEAHFVRTVMGCGPCEQDPDADCEDDDDEEAEEDVLPLGPHILPLPAEQPDPAA